MQLSQTVVTKEVAAALDALELTRVLYKNAVYVVETLLDKSWSEYSHDGWLYLNRAYLRKAYGSKYLTLFQALEAADILEVCHDYTFYAKGESPEGVDTHPKAYRVKHSAFEDGYAIRDSRAEDEDRDVMETARREQVIDALARLELDYEAAMKYAYDHAQSLTLAKDYYVNDEIFEDVIQMTAGKKVFFGQVAKAATYASSKGEVVIQNLKQPNRGVVANPEQFITEARATVKFQWARAVTKIEAGIFRARRNATNHRLDTNLTNLPSVLCQFLTVEGEQLGAWDASNSQFAMLAAVIRHPELFKDETCKFFQRYVLDEQTARFLQYATEGGLYQKLANDWGLTKDEAKVTAFCVAFSGASATSKAKSLLKEKYPQLVKMTDDYKREFGDNALAITLQRAEAEVFIDGAYYELLDHQVWSLTKHDSIIVKESDKAIGEHALRAAMRKHGVVANLVWDTMKPKPREKRVKQLTSEACQA